MDYEHDDKKNSSMLWEDLGVNGNILTPSTRIYNAFYTFDVND
jgi:hypothetical protein